jgi:hypothetical protein
MLFSCDEYLKLQFVGSLIGGISLVSKTRLASFFGGLYIIRNTLVLHNLKQVINILWLHRGEAAKSGRLQSGTIQAVTLHGL